MSVTPRDPVGEVTRRSKSHLQKESRTSIHTLSCRLSPAQEAAFRSKGQDGPPCPGQKPLPGEPQGTEQGSQPLRIPWLRMWVWTARRKAVAKVGYTGEQESSIPGSVQAPHPTWPAPSPPEGPSRAFLRLQGLESPSRVLWGHQGTHPLQTHPPSTPPPAVLAPHVGISPLASQFPLILGSWGLGWPCFMPSTQGQAGPR